MLLQDIRFGVRTAPKNKGVTAIAVVCLTIGIGLNTMMFTVVDGVLVQPLPYRNPNQLVELDTTHQGSGIHRGGGIALLLAAVGVYGVLSYSVALRTQEIGVRVALGAARADVLKLVIVDGVKLAAIGVLLGALGSFFVTPVIKTELYNVSPTDPISFLAVSVFLTTIAFVASYVPARRATAVDPLIALRTE